jgi:hypothetical protein
MMLMKNIYLLLIISLLTFFSNSPLFCQSTYSWIGSGGTGGNGTWNTATHWSPSRTTANAGDILQFNAGGAPTVTVGAGFVNGCIRITNSTSVTLSATSTRNMIVTNGTGNDLVIDSNSGLTIGTSINITLAASATADISGTLTINSGRTYNTTNIAAITTVLGRIVNLGIVTNTVATNLVFSNGSTYQHSQDGGTIPTATWDVSSTCFVTGMSTTLPGGIAQTFGNLTWNCINQTISSTPGNAWTINGNLTVQSTGNGQFRMGTGTTSNNNVLGNYLQYGGTVRISGVIARTLNVNGNFNLSGGTFLMSSGTAIGTLTLDGDFIHTNGTITETSTGSGSIIFHGSSIQSYTGGGIISNTINFTTNNSAGITLLTSVTFPAGLTMTRGNITTGSNTLTLGTSTTNLGTLSYQSGTIIGNFRRWFATGTVSNVLFPIGTSTNYRPANISFTGAITTGGTLTAFFTSTNPGTAGLPLNDGGLSIINTGKEGYWTINATTLAGGTYSLDLTADGFTGVSVVSTLRLLKRSTGGNWILQGTHLAGTGTITTPIVHRTGMSGFSEFGVGSASDNPLPVELSSFNAVVSESCVILSWKTETEVSNYGFEVQKSENRSKESEWNTIGFVEGHGNSNSPKYYSFTDNVVSGKYAYRLKQIDTDGQFAYSNVIEVDAGNIPDKFVLEQNYPNPFNPVTTIKFSLPESGNVKLTIYNLLGEQVEEPINEFKNAGVYTINFNASILNSGVYIYKVESNGFVQSRKMTLIK